MTTSKASKGVNEVTTTNERTNEQTKAATNPAGELPALPKPAVPAMQRGYPGMQPSYTQPDYYTAEQMHAYAREALAASHRERSERDVPNGANCAQSEVDPLTQYAADFIDGWIEGESEEVKRNWTRVRKAVLAPPSPPADKPTECQTCNDVGVIGGTSGQTPESFEQVTKACPDCKPAGQAVSRSDAAQATDAWPNGEYRLWDYQWVNVVNFDRGHESFDKEGAVNHAVKLTEKYMRENIQRAALSEAKRSHVSGDTLAPEPATAGNPRPDGCRNRLQAEGKAYPRSGCVVCKTGGIAGCPYERATPAAAVPDGWRDFIRGMSVSVDVSTNDDEAGNRIFGTITEVMDDRESKHGVILLVQDNVTANFAAATPNRPADNSQPVAARDAQRQLAAEFRDRFMTYGRDMRARNFEEVRYWLDQYRNLAQDMLAASPADISQPQVAHPLPASGANVVCDQSEVSK